MKYVATGPVIGDTYALAKGDTIELSEEDAAEGVKAGLLVEEGSKKASAASKAETK